MASRKVIVIGDPGVGKTSLVRRLVHREFRAGYISTFGVDIYTYVVEIPAPARSAYDGATELRLMIWDTQGDLGVNVFKHPHGQGASAALIVADVTSPATHQTLLTLATGFDERYPGRPFTLVFNKRDLLDGAQEFQLPPGCDPARHSIIVTSAKTGERVAQTFEETAVSLIRRGL